MASGPTGTGWSYFASDLNTKFTPGNNIQATANNFKQKHGSNGNGRERGTTPYKFGHFVDKGKLLSGTALGQFMIDSGERHWHESSLDLLENTIKHSLTHTTPKQITFIVEDNTDGDVKAKAAVYNQNGYDRNNPTRNRVATPAEINAATSFTVVVQCPQPNPRPNPGP